MRYRIWANLTAAGLLATATLFTGLACDDKNDLPPEVIKAQREQQERQRAAASRPAPTTQELLTGPKKHLRLVGMPLALDVPPSWDLKSLADGALILVSGPATSAEISIQLTAQAGQAVSVARLADIVARAKQEANAKPHPINRVELRDLGPAKVLEERMISNELVNGKLPPEVWGEQEIKNENDPATPVIRVKAILNPHIVKWRLTVYLPTSKDQVTPRSLNFMGLKLSEYEQDKQFLEQLMKTLTYEE
jgi:hypothetical protein